MIVSEHALKGNGDKLVKEFLSTLESATSRLDICECYVLVEKKVRRKCEGQIFSVTQPVRKLLICLSCQL